MSLSLLYTGATKFDTAQTDPLLSLGGFISSSTVPNGLINNLFADISRYTIFQNEGEIRVVAIKNTGATTKTGLKAYFVYPNTDDSEPTNNSDAYFTIAYAAAVTDDCGDLMSPEKLVSPYAEPYSVTLVEADGIDNAIDIPDLEAGDYAILFIRRLLKPELQEPLTDDQLEEILDEELVLPTIEDIDLILAWD